MKLAMWCGPRNISTAMMRSWEARGDTYVCDEPLYAHYLKATGLQHHVTDQVIASQENDWRKVVAWLTGPIPEGKANFYQKHMCHHMLPQIDRGWMAQVENAFLIRDPREMLTSFIKHIPNPTLSDTAYAQQAGLYQDACKITGKTPIVLDSKDILSNPAKMLAATCKALGVDYTDKMLQWGPGYRPTDGVWAPYWYKEVVTTTGFQPYKHKEEEVPAHLKGLLDECMDFYKIMHKNRLTA